MQRRSPPKHRHDGTSPLPLGMDWSPPPKNWTGTGTVWPHDPHTGWSYCVTIPSWVVLAKSKDSDPVVFYRVLIGVQSPEGITTTRTVLRRFNDFLKLFAAIKSKFPRKNLPSAPPKGFLRMKTRALLEERRRSLEEWMTKLLSDIEVSRSMAVASFLELEAAARSSFQEDSQHVLEEVPSVNSTVPTLQVHPDARLSALAGSSSLTSDYGSDTAYETSDVGSPSIGRDNHSEVGMEELSLDEDFSSPIDKFVKYGMSNIDEGLMMGRAILEQLEKFPRHKLLAAEMNNTGENNIINEDASSASSPARPITRLPIDQGSSKIAHHAHKLSGESAKSDLNSQRGSESSNSTDPCSNGRKPVHLGSAYTVSEDGRIFGSQDLQIHDNVQLVLPLDQQSKLNRVLVTMQQRLATAKTDMEDLISRLNQETAVKEYLTTKVNDLEVELQTTRLKSKETLEQAILIESERMNKMQWEMEDLRRKSLELELKLNSQQDPNAETKATNLSTHKEEEVLLQELETTKTQLDLLLKRHQEVELKSKAEIKVLIKEVRSLRRSQDELEQQLSLSVKEKSDAERLLEQERHSHKHAKSNWMKLLRECETLHNKFYECKVDLLDEDEANPLSDFPPLPDTLDVLEASDDRISHLLTKVNRLSLDEDDSGVPVNNIYNADDDTESTHEELRKVLTDLIVDNGRLRKQVNSVLRYALRMNKEFQKDVWQAPSTDVVHNNDSNI